MRIYTLRVIVLGCVLVVGTGCAAFRERAESEAREPSPADPVDASTSNGAAPSGEATHEAELKSQVRALQNKLEEVEGRLTAMTEKMDVLALPRRQLEQRPSDSRGAVSVNGHPVDRLSGVPASDNPVTLDGSLADSAVASFREAIVLYNSGRFSESVLGFSGFLERYADHPFAGSAQFYVAESYYRQGELKLALAEYQRVLTAYDRSAKVPDSLARIATIQDKLGKPSEAAKARQSLMSLFPGSPAAAARADDRSESSPDPAAPIPTADTTELAGAEPPPAPQRAAVVEDVGVTERTSKAPPPTKPYNETPSGLDAPPASPPRVPSPTAVLQGNVPGSANGI